MADKMAAILAAILAAQLLGAEGSLSKRSDLRRAIFLGYDKLVNPDQQVTVTVGVYATDISYCAHKQQMALDGWLLLTWHDLRLGWNTETWNGLEELRVPSSNLWMPDLAVYNGLGEQNPEPVWKPGNNAVVRADGKVIFAPRVTDLHTFCKANLTGHPWSVQNCPLVFGSWTYDMTELNVVPDGEEPIKTKYMVNERMSILSSSWQRQETEYDCCPGEKYPMLTMNVQFKRVAKFCHKANKLVTPDDPVEEEDDDSSEENTVEN